MAFLSSTSSTSRGEYSGVKSSSTKHWVVSQLQPSSLWSAPSLKSNMKELPFPEASKKSAVSLAGLLCAYGEKGSTEKEREGGREEKREGEGQRDTAHVVSLFTVWKPGGMAN